EAEASMDGWIVRLGDATSVSTVDKIQLVPATVALHPAYPNPFNPSTSLAFDLPEAAAVQFIVYDMLGREVARLVDGYIESGTHHATWNGRTASGREVPTGIYIARLVTPEYSKSIKMVMLK
ncbi:MAG: T9SS type A sorting domain-containing protein, partial [Fidelibacterota bacterium]